MNDVQRIGTKVEVLSSLYIAPLEPRAMWMQQSIGRHARYLIIIHSNGVSIPYIACCYGILVTNGLNEQVFAQV